MKATKLLHSSLSTACPDMHKIRLETLIAEVTSGLTEHQVTVAGLGRNLKSHSKTTTKHGIKRMDRLIGNHYLHAECKDIYQYISTLLINWTTKISNTDS